MLMLNQGLSDPHSGMNMLTHFSSIQKMPTMGKAQAVATPVIGTARPAQGRVKRHRHRGTLSLWPSRTLASNWYLRLHACTSGLRILLLTGVKTVFAAPPREEAIPENAWPTRTGWGCQHPCEESRAIWELGTAIPRGPVAEAS